MVSRSKTPFSPPVFPLHFVDFQMRRQRQPKPLEQYGLVFGRLRHTAAADVYAGPGWQHNVHHLYLRNLVEYLSWLVAQTRFVAHLPQRFPDDVRQEANQNVSLYPLFPLMPYRTDRQIALRYPKRSLGLRKLDVSLPEFFRRQVRYVAGSSPQKEPTNHARSQPLTKPVRPDRCCLSHLS